jgi:acyl-[acyl carrier protein]--UDP-N-acetylglucosamine O-acyltransferase
VAHDAPVQRGTVLANEVMATGNISCKTVCFTTPCCAPTVTCL